MIKEEITWTLYDEQNARSRTGANTRMCKYTQLPMSMWNLPSAQKTTLEMKCIEHSKFERNQTDLSCRREVRRNCISVIFRVSVVCFCSGPELHWDEECHHLTLSVQCSTCMCVCHLCMCVCCLLKCVNSDNAPHCPHWGCRDIAILCLRCEESQEEEMHTEKYWNSLEYSLQERGAYWHWHRSGTSGIQFYFKKRFLLFRVIIFWLLQLLADIFIALQPSRVGYLE